MPDRPVYAPLDTYTIQKLTKMAEELGITRAKLIVRIIKKFLNEEEKHGTNIP